MRCDILDLILDQGKKKKVNNVGQLVKFEQLDNFTVVILFVKLWEAR